MKRLYQSRLAHGYRFSKPTRSEAVRVAATWTGRIGPDLRETIRALARETGLTQGDIGRVLLLAGLAELEAGRLSLVENGPDPAQKERIDGSEA